MGHGGHGSGDSWRQEMLLEVESGDFRRASSALLSLTYHEADRSWIEDVLIDLVEHGEDFQLRALAVICLGHVARIHRAVTKEKVLPLLHALEHDAALRSRAQNALEDISVFVRDLPVRAAFPAPPRTSPHLSALPSDAAKLSGRDIRNRGRE